jgi:HK97 family phage major capsid protein
MNAIEHKLRDVVELPMQTREFQILEFKALPREQRQKTPKPEGGAPAGERAATKDDPDGDGDTDDDEDAADEERFEIAISSEYPVQRWYGIELLEHSKSAIDLSRAKLGLSFLDSHDVRQIIGIVDDVRLDGDKVLRGAVRFSRSQKAQDVKRDIKDGIRKFISVGYGVNEWVLEKSSKTEGDTYRATKWTPMEASSVAVPADPTVGHDRSAGERKFPVKFRSSNQNGDTPHTEARMEPTAQVTESRNAAAEIVRLGKVHGIESERVASMISEGMTVEQASRQILDEVAKRGAKPLNTPSTEENQERETLQLSDREQEQYNIARGIMAHVNEKEGGKRDNCFELEVSQELEKKHRGATKGGLLVPWSLRMNISRQLQKRAGLDSKTTNKGAELIFTEPGEFIDFLYNRMRVKELGARTISGLRDNIAFPKQSGKASGSWVGENPGTDVADSNLTLGQVLSSPKTYQSSTSYSRQLLAQAVIDVDSLVRADLATDMALALDFVSIQGTGAGANQPTGILNTSGVQSYVMIADTANGGLPSWDDIVLMSQALEDVNADQIGEGAWLTTPPLKSRLKRIARLNNTMALPIWADDNTVDGYTARSSNQVPKNLTKGTGTNLSALIRGIFETIVIGMWGSGFELVVDPYRLKKQGMIELTTFMMTDVALRYPQAFVVATDVIK